MPRDLVEATRLSLPASPAGRLQFLSDLLHGLPIVDADGNPTGERTGPFITKEQFVKLLDGPDGD